MTIIYDVAEHYRRSLWFQKNCNISEFDDLKFSTYDDDCEVNPEFPNGHVSFSIMIEDSKYYQYLKEFERKKFDSIKHKLVTKYGLPQD
jgi:hypothetical protein